MDDQKALADNQKFQSGCPGGDNYYFFLNSDTSN